MILKKIAAMFESIANFFVSCVWYFLHWSIEAKIALITLLITGYIGYIANTISENQSIVMMQQSWIMQEQTLLQEKFLNFEQRKFAAEIAKKSEEEANKLFDLTMMADREAFQEVYLKVKEGKKVENNKLLDWFVSEFENIGRLYCNGEMQYNDLDGVLKGVIEPVCWNAQIYHHYQNTKSGIAGLCKSLFPKSTVMAKYADPMKCRILAK